MMKRFLLLITLVLLTFAPALAQDKSLTPVPRIQFLSTSGTPLAGGHVHAYISSTTTNQATYTDAGGGTANANPVLLDSGGFAAIWLTPGESYTLAVHNSADVLQYSVDSVTSGTLDTNLVVGTTAVTFNATPTFNSATSVYFSITLTGNVTSSTLSNAIDGRVVLFNICQDATGGRTFVWPATVLNAPTIGSGVSVCTSVSYIYDGTNWREIAPSSRGSAVFDTTTTGVSNNVRMVDGIKYACNPLGTGINNAYTDLPVTGGTVDATFCEGAQTFGSVTVSAITRKPVTIFLPSGVITGTATPFFDVGGNERMRIIGRGWFDEASGQTLTGTTLAKTNAGAIISGIEVKQTLISDLNLDGTGLATTGILFDGSFWNTIQRVAGGNFSANTDACVDIRSQGTGAFGGQHTYLEQVNCRANTIKIDGTGSRFTTVQLNTTYARLYDIDVVGNLVMVNATAESVAGDSSGTLYDFNDVTSVTMVGCDVEGNAGVTNYTLATVASFVIVGNDESGHLGNNISGAPSESGFMTGRGFDTVIFASDAGDQRFQIGTNPALTGLIGIPNDSVISGRNAANSADIQMLAVTTANDLRVGGTNTSSILLRVGSTDVAEVRSTEFRANRIKTNGTALVAGDFSLAGAWGTTATVDTVSGDDQQFSFDVNSSGTGQGANPTIILTATDGTWTNAPTVVCGRGDLTQPTIPLHVTTITATAITFTWIGTPVAAEDYSFRCIVMGDA